MSLTSSQLETIIQVDKMVKSMMESAGEGETVYTAILIKGHDHMPKIMEIIESSDDEEMDKYAETYTGFYLYMKLLEHLAQGIQDGIVTVPD